MSERDAFLKAIAANPHDRTTQVVFADWLDDHGEPDLAAAYRTLDWSGSGAEVLIGATADGISIAGEDSLYLENEWNVYEMSAYGDCCSESWFYSITGLEHLIGHKILKIIEPSTDDVNAEDGLCSQEVDSVYAVGLVTGSGVCRIVYRNSSNGYYGGWIVTTKHPLGAVPNNATPIKGDWFTARTPVQA